MLSDYKKAIVNGRVTTVVTPQEALTNKVYQNKFSSVEINGVILPVKTSYDPSSPGFYISNDNKIGKIIYPSDKDADEYSAKNAVDFSNVKSMKELISKQEEVKKMESEVLSNSDNLFKPIPKENDSPEMKALKKAVCLKNIDIDAYADRFGDNFNNDKRLLKSSSVTMSKLKSFCNNFDMKCTLTITDKNPNVPNPIGQEIVVDICGGYHDNETDD